MHGDSPFGNGYIDSAQSELSDKSLGSALTWINLNALFGWKLIKTDNKKASLLTGFFILVLVTVKGDVIDQRQSGLTKTEQIQK